MALYQQPVFQRRKSMIFQIKACALITIASFLLPIVSWAFEPATYGINQPALIHFNHLAKPLAIPENLGNVRESFQGSDKVVVSIEDLHCNYEVQKNIAGLISYLAKTQHLKLVGEEGAFHRVDTSVITSFPVDRIREKVSDYFVRQGKMTGAEYVAAVNHTPIILEGIESPQLYLASEKVVHTFLNAESQGYIYDLRALLEQLKKTVYSKALMEFDRKRQAYRTGHLTLLHYAAFLGKTALHHGLTPADYPALDQYLQGHEGGFSSDQLIQEMDDLDAKLRGFLYQDPKERQMDEAWQRVDLMEKLLNISATQKELAAFRQERSAFTVSSMAAALASLQQSQSEHRVLSMDPELYQLDNYLKQAETFYHLADRRSKAFVDKLLAKMEDHHQNLAVMINGGFHAQEVLKDLKKRGVSYIAIRPRLTHPDVLNPYFELLQGRQTPLEKLLAKHQKIMALRSGFEEITFKGLLLVALKPFGLLLRKRRMPLILSGNLERALETFQRKNETLFKLASEFTPQEYMKYHLPSGIIAYHTEINQTKSILLIVPTRKVDQSKLQLQRVLEYEIYSDFTFIHLNNFNRDLNDDESLDAQMRKTVNTVIAKSTNTGLDFYQIIKNAFKSINNRPLSWRHFVFPASGIDLKGLYTPFAGFDINKVMTSAMQISVRCSLYFGILAIAWMTVVDKNEFVKWMMSVGAVVLGSLTANLFGSGSVNLSTPSGLAQVIEETGILNICNYLDDKTSCSKFREMANNYNVPFLAGPDGDTILHGMVNYFHKLQTEGDIKKIRSALKEMKKISSDFFKQESVVIVTNNYYTNMETINGLSLIGDEPLMNVLNSEHQRKDVLLDKVYRSLREGRHRFIFWKKEEADQQSVEKRKEAQSVLDSHIRLIEANFQALPMMSQEQEKMTRARLELILRIVKTMVEESAAVYNSMRSPSFNPDRQINALRGKLEALTRAISDLPENQLDGKSAYNLIYDPTPWHNFADVHSLSQFINFVHQNSFDILKSSLDALHYHPLNLKVHGKKVRLIDVNPEIQFDAGGIHSKALGLFLNGFDVTVGFAINPIIIIYKDMVIADLNLEQARFVNDATDSGHSIDVQCKLAPPDEGGMIKVRHVEHNRSRALMIQTIMKALGAQSDYNPTRLNHVLTIRLDKDHGARSAFHIEKNLTLIVKVLMSIWDNDLLLDDDRKAVAAAERFLTTHQIGHFETWKPIILNEEQREKINNRLKHLRLEGTVTAGRLTQPILEKYVNGPIQHALARGELEWNKNETRLKRNPNYRPIDRLVKDINKRASAKEMIQSAEAILPILDNVNWEPVGSVGQYIAEIGTFYDSKGKAYVATILRDYQYNDIAFARVTLKTTPGKRMSSSTVRRLIGSKIGHELKPIEAIADEELNNSLALLTIPWKKTEVPGLTMFQGRTMGANKTGQNRLILPVTFRAEDSAGKLYIAQSLKPEDVTFIPHLGGIIQEGTALLSHVSVLVREFGVPSINLPNMNILTTDEGKKICYLENFEPLRQVPTRDGYWISRTIRKHIHVLTEGQRVMIDAGSGALVVSEKTSGNTDLLKLAYGTRSKKYSRPVRRQGGKGVKINNPIVPKTSTIRRLGNEMSTYVRIGELESKDYPAVGPKAEQLDQLAKNAETMPYEVPGGIVVTAKFYQDLLEKNGIEEKLTRLLNEQTMSPQEVAKQFDDVLQDLLENKTKWLEEQEKKISTFLKGIDPDERWWAVRSAGLIEDTKDFSFTGLGITDLYVHRDHVLEHVILNLRSLASPSAVAYLRENGLSLKGLFHSVIVQKMQPGDVSGVAFTSDPVIPSDHVVINAAYGLNEGIVSGIVAQPDEYTVDENNYHEVGKKIGNKRLKVVPDPDNQNVQIMMVQEGARERALTRRQVALLARLAKKIKERYGDSDFEWTIDKGKLYLFQRRPITTKGNTNIKNGRSMTGGSWPWMRSLWLRAGLPGRLYDQWFAWLLENGISQIVGTPALGMALIIIDLITNSHLGGLSEATIGWFVFFLLHFIQMLDLETKPNLGLSLHSDRAPPATVLIPALVITILGITFQMLPLSPLGLGIHFFMNIISPYLAEHIWLPLRNLAFHFFIQKTNKAAGPSRGSKYYRLVLVASIVAYLFWLGGLLDLIVGCYLVYHFMSPEILTRAKAAGTPHDRVFALRKFELSEKAENSVNLIAADSEGNIAIAPRVATFSPYRQYVILAQILMGPKFYLSTFLGRFLTPLVGVYLLVQNKLYHYQMMEFAQKIEDTGLLHALILIDNQRTMNRFVRMAKQDRFGLSRLDLNADSAKELLARFADFLEEHKDDKNGDALLEKTRALASAFTKAMDVLLVENTYHYPMTYANDLKIVADETLSDALAPAETVSEPLLHQLLGRYENAKGRYFIFRNKEQAIAAFDNQRRQGNRFQHQRKLIETYFTGLQLFAQKPRKLNREYIKRMFEIVGTMVRETSGIYENMRMLGEDPGNRIKLMTDKLDYFEKRISRIPDEELNNASTFEFIFGKKRWITFNDIQTLAQYMDFLQANGVLLLKGSLEKVAQPPLQLRLEGKRVRMIDIDEGPMFDKGGVHSKVLRRFFYGWDIPVNAIDIQPTVILYRDMIIADLNRERHQFGDDAYQTGHWIDIQCKLKAPSEGGLINIRYLEQNASRSIAIQKVLRALGFSTQYEHKLLTAQFNSITGARSISDIENVLPVVVKLLLSTWDNDEFIDNEKRAHLVADNYLATRQIIRYSRWPLLKIDERIRQLINARMRQLGLKTRYPEEILSQGNLDQYVNEPIEHALERDELEWDARRSRLVLNPDYKPMERLLKDLNEPVEAKELLKAAEIILPLYENVRWDAIGAVGKYLMEVGVFRDENGIAFVMTILKDIRTNDIAFARVSSKKYPGVKVGADELREMVSYKIGHQLKPIEDIPDEEVDNYLSMLRKPWRDSYGGNATVYPGKIISYGPRKTLLEALRVTFNPENSQGKLYITENLSPDNVTFMPGLGGVLQEGTSLLSHTAVLLREFKIPCLNLMNMDIILKPDGTKCARLESYEPTDIHVTAEGYQVARRIIERSYNLEEGQFVIFNQMAGEISLAQDFKDLLRLLRDKKRRREEGRKLAKEKKKIIHEYQKKKLADDTRYFVRIGDMKNNEIDATGTKAREIDRLQHDANELDYQIPPGIIVTAKFYEDLISKHGLRKPLMELLNNTRLSPEEVARQFKQILLAVMHQKSPWLLEQEESLEKALKAVGGNEQWWAVRSAGIEEDQLDHSFAGLGLTDLYVHSDHIMEHLILNVAALAEPSAMKYRQENGLQIRRILHSAIVEKMQPGQVSGVTFSKDPVTGDNTHYVITAAFGLNEGILKGHVATPDEYLVRADNNHEQGKTIGDKKFKVVPDLDHQNVKVVVNEDNPRERALSREQVSRLAHLASVLKNRYGHCDFEWTISDGQLYLFQRRPITTGQTKEGDVEYLTKTNDFQKKYFKKNVFEVLFRQEGNAREMIAILLKLIPSLGVLTGLFFWNVGYTILGIGVITIGMLIIIMGKILLTHDYARNGNDEKGISADAKSGLPNWFDVIKFLIATAIVLILLSFSPCAFGMMEGITQTGSVVVVGIVATIGSLTILARNFKPIIFDDKGHRHGVFDGSKNESRDSQRAKKAIETYSSEDLIKSNQAVDFKNYQKDGSNLSLGALVNQLLDFSATTEDGGNGFVRWNPAKAMFKKLGDRFVLKFIPGRAKESNRRAAGQSAVLNGQRGSFLLKITPPLIIGGIGMFFILNVSPWFGIAFMSAWGLAYFIYKKLGDKPVKSTVEWLEDLNRSQRQKPFWTWPKLLLAVAIIAAVAAYFNQDIISLYHFLFFNIASVFEVNRFSKTGQAAATSTASTKDLTQQVAPTSPSEEVQLDAVIRAQGFNHQILGALSEQSNTPWQQIWLNLTQYLTSRWMMSIRGQEDKLQGPIQEKDQQLILNLFIKHYIHSVPQLFGLLGKNVKIAMAKTTETNNEGMLHFDAATKTYSLKLPAYCFNNQGRLSKSGQWLLGMTMSQIRMDEQKQVDVNYNREELLVAQLQRLVLDHQSLKDAWLSHLDQGKENSPNGLMVVIKSEVYKHDLTQLQREIKIIAQQAKKDSLLQNELNALLKSIANGDRHRQRQRHMMKYVNQAV